MRERKGEKWDTKTEKGAKKIRGERTRGGGVKVDGEKKTVGQTFLDTVIFFQAVINDNNESSVV